MLDDDPARWAQPSSPATPSDPARSRMRRTALPLLCPRSRPPTVSSRARIPRRASGCSVKKCCPRSARSARSSGCGVPSKPTRPSASRFLTRRRRPASAQRLITRHPWRFLDARSLLPRRSPPRLRRRLGCSSGARRDGARHHGLGPARDAGVALARPRRHGGAHHPVHGALRAPRRALEADARQHQHAEPRRVVDRLEGRDQLRVRPAQERQVPQRRSGDRGGREVHVRALQGRVGPAPQGQGEGGPGRRAEPGALRAQGGVAGLHGLLRHLGHRRRLDRAQEVHREGGRGRLQEGTGGRRAVQVRVVSAGDRARARGVPRLLAQGAVGEAHRHAQHSRREHAGRRRQDGRGRHRVSLRRRGRRGAPTHARRQDHGAPALRHVLARLPRPVGPEVALARPPRPSGREPRHRS